MRSFSTSASWQSARSWASWRTPAKTRATSSGNLKWVFTPPSWWRAMSRYSRRLTTPRKVRRAVLRRECCEAARGFRRQKLVEQSGQETEPSPLIHLPPLLLLCVFGLTFQSLVVVAVCASKSFAVRRSSKLSRRSQLIRAELSSNLSQSSFGCLRQDSIPVSWVDHCS